MSKFREFDFSDMKQRSINDRKSKVSIADFAKKSDDANSFISSLPKLLSAKALNDFILRLQAIRKASGNILTMIGGHVIKCGLAPILADMAEKQFITAVAGNGSVAIHDVEIALFGETSETVENEIDDGMFGMTKETADFINDAQKRAQKQRLGFGEMLGISLEDAPYKEYSLLWQIHKLGLPFTIHPLPGAEVVHLHPGFDGSAMGEVAQRDFAIFTDIVANLDDGAVINFGSAVVMPELFVKALSASRNRGNKVTNITAANFDQIQHYRPLVNVLGRPVRTGGRSYAFTGHHEIMIPLLASLL